MSEIVYRRRDLYAPIGEFTEESAVVATNGGIGSLLIEFKPFLARSADEIKIAFEQFGDIDGWKLVGMLDINQETFSKLVSICEPLVTSSDWQVCGTIELEGPYPTATASPCWHPVRRIEAERRRRIR